MEIAHRFIGGTICQDFSPVWTADGIDVSSRSYRDEEFTKILECTRGKVSEFKIPLFPGHNKSMYSAFKKGALKLKSSTIVEKKIVEEI